MACLVDVVLTAGLVGSGAEPRRVFRGVSGPSMIFEVDIIVGFCGSSRALVAVLPDDDACAVVGTFDVGVIPERVRLPELEPSRMFVRVTLVKLLCWRGGMAILGDSSCR